MFRSLPHFVAHLYHFGESFLVFGGEKLSLQGHSEESSDIIPILFDDMLSALGVMVPVLLHLASKECKLLIVGVLLDCGLALEAVDDQSEADLGIAHADTHILLEKLRKCLPAQIFPLLVQPLHKFIDLLVVQLQEVAVGRIEEPILRAVPGLHGHKQHPVVGDGEHEAHHQRLLGLVPPKVGNQSVQLPPLLLGKQQVLVLELPREGQELIVVLLAEDGEIGCMFKAEAIIGPFEISMEDILLLPRPLIGQTIARLHLEEELLDPAFKTPEGSAAQDIVVRLPAMQKREEAQGVEGRMISAEISSALLVALDVMDVVGGVVDMRYQLGQRSIWDRDGSAAYITQYILQDIIPELADLFGNDRNLHLSHYVIILMNSDQA